MNSNKNKFYTFILITAIIIASCSQDCIENEPQLLSSINKTTQKLLDFKQNMLVKSSGTLPSDSAEWHLEGLLNYEQANNIHAFNQVDFLYDTLPWPSINGVVSFEDLQKVYISINELAQNMVLQSGYDNYTFDVIDLQVLETSLKNGEQSIIVGLSGGLLDPIQTYILFGSTDYWESGGLKGKCDIYAGQLIGRDATTELERRFKDPLTLPSYFVSVESIFALFDDNETTDNPYGYYMMWVENTNQSNNCLSPDELNYYLSKWDYLKNKYKPVDKTFCSVDVREDYIVSGSQSFHTYVIKYGINIGSNPE